MNEMVCLRNAIRNFFEKCSSMWWYACELFVRQSCISLRQDWSGLVPMQEAVNSQCMNIIPATVWCVFQTNTNSAWSLPLSLDQKKASYNCKSPCFRVFSWYFFEVFGNICVAYVLYIIHIQHFENVKFVNLITCI